MVLATTTLFGWLFLPSFVHFPNGYSLRVTREPPRYATAVDNKLYVSLELPGGSALGDATLSLRFGQDNRPMGAGASTLRLRLEWDF
jgi:hypothetical protein